MPKQKQIEDYEKEEWGGWIFVMEMLGSPDKNGIYPTSKCYKKLYDFVVAQKEKARQQERKKTLEEIEEVISEDVMGVIRNELKK